MSGVDPRVAETMRELRRVAGGAAKEQGTMPSQPEKADIMHRRDTYKSQTTAQ